MKKKLGAYEVIELIGSGGMGEVYRAHDTKLGREVAVKVLPEAFSKDAERLARFEREARLLASLNHPNIATIHGLEQSGATRFLVMELVPGETLADRIKNGALPVEDALPLFMQIADGLEAAHEKGVIHRDLKPANIKLTPDEKVKVLDFGLAKATVGTPSGDLSESPTITKAATETGVILGTAGYMSPEQARGKTVDKRTDIWAFGCCLYEALTGQITFQGDTLSDTIASVLRQDPDWQALPGTTPRSVRRLLERCLQKDPRRRFRDAWDVRVELEEAVGEPSQPGRVASTPLPSSLRQAAPWIAAVGFALLTAGVAIWSLTRSGPTSPGAVTKLRLPTPPLPAHGRMDLSPDGTRLAYIAEENGTTHLYLRNLNELDAKRVEGTEGVYWQPFFSPDGEWIGFHADEKLKKVPVAGGTPVTLCDAPRLRLVTWGADDRIYFNSNRYGRGVSSVSAAGGTPEIVTTPEGPGRHFPLDFLPGAKAILIGVEGLGPEDVEGATIQAYSLETGEYRTLVKGTLYGAGGRYASSGHLVFFRAGTLMGAPFDVRSLEITGPETPVLQDLWGPHPKFAISDNGTLAYVPGNAEPVSTLVWVNREGQTRPVTNERHRYEAPRISPDGQRIAVEIQREGTYDIWVQDIRRGTLTRLTLAPSAEAMPVWTPDGRRIAFLSTRDGPRNLYWKPADGSAPAERLTEHGIQGIPLSWSPDGVLAFQNEGDIWMLPTKGEGKPELFLSTPFSEVAAEFSPDGRWLAYISNESGHDPEGDEGYEVYVRAYPGPGPRYPISVAGGTQPLWSRDGQELFYRTQDDELMVVPVELTPEFRAGKPRVLFEGQFEWGGTNIRNYDIASDGQRFVMIQAEEESARTEIVVVLNWHEELKRLVPTK